MLKGDLRDSRAICEFGNLGSFVADTRVQISVKRGKAVILSKLSGVCVCGLCAQMRVCPRVCVCVCMKHSV